MCVINAVRNKLVYRIFAVIRDERFFEDNYIKNCAQAWKRIIKIFLDCSTLTIIIKKQVIKKPI